MHDRIDGLSAAVDRLVGRGYRISIPLVLGIENKRGNIVLSLDESESCVVNPWFDLARVQELLAQALELATTCYDEPYYFRVDRAPLTKPSLRLIADSGARVLPSTPSTATRGGPGGPPVEDRFFMG